MRVIRAAMAFVSPLLMNILRTYVRNDLEMLTCYLNPQ